MCARYCSYVYVVDIRKASQEENKMFQDAVVTGGYIPQADVSLEGLANTVATLMPCRSLVHIVCHDHPTRLQQEPPQDTPTTLHHQGKYYMLDYNEDGPWNCTDKPYLRKT